EPGRGPGNRHGRGALRGGRPRAVGYRGLPAQLYPNPGTYDRRRGLPARGPVVHRLAVGGISAGRAIPAHSSRRRRDGDANAAGPAFYDQPSAGPPLAGVLVVDVGRDWRDPLNADSRYYQDHLRPHPPADGVRSLYRRVKALSKEIGRLHSVGRPASPLKIRLLQLATNSIQTV